MTKALATGGEIRKIITAMKILVSTWCVPLSLTFKISEAINVS